MSCEEIVVQPWLLHWQLTDGCEAVLDTGDKGQEELGLLWSEGSESGSRSGSGSGSECMSNKAGLWAKCSGSAVWVGLPSDEARRRRRHERIGDEVGRMLGVGIIFVCH